MIPSDIAPGAGMIRIGADATNAVSESNERNNTAEFPITITGGPF
jgi:subtilase family serine protease